MPIRKDQLHRLTRIVALLRENRYPNSASLVREFRRMAVEEELGIECSRKTVLRDLSILRTEFRCPLAFDRIQNGYFLRNHEWEFAAPVRFDENGMLAATVGARIAEAIFPAPLKNRIREAVDALLQGNNSDFLDTANLSSLSILSGLWIDLDPAVFETVFTGWQKRRRIRIDYVDFNGEETRRGFEPNTLVFFNNSWYTKGLCLLKNQVRTFAIQRIRHAELMNGTFEPDPKILRSVTIDDFLGFEKIVDVELAITHHVSEQLKANPLHSGQQFRPDGRVRIPEISREVLFPWLLARMGEAELLSPVELRSEFRGVLDTMCAAYRGTPEL